MPHGLANTNLFVFLDLNLSHFSEFFHHNICCHLSATVVAYTAGVSHPYSAATLYITLTDTPF